MRFRDSRGFTIIELLMVILLVAILAAVAIPQFLDFRTEAKDAATNSAVGALRTGIANQKGNMILRCAAAPGAWPSAAAVNANTVITNGCTAVQVPIAAEGQFVAGANIPDNPWTTAPGTAGARAVTACSGGGCTKTAGTDCAGAAYTAATDGWCYNPATGDIWANSNKSTGPKKEWEF